MKDKTYFVNIKSKLTCKHCKRTEIVKNIARCNFLITDVYKIIHFWNGNESENPFMISNLTKNAVFFRK